MPGTGVVLNNFHYWAEVDPRGTNTMRPGEPLALPLAPCIATRDGNAVLALGTPGGYGICQTQVQALIQHIDYRLGLQDAIEAPRARLWDARVVQVESRLDAEVLAQLRHCGHDVRASGEWLTEVGGMQAIAVDPATGVMTGAADPRRNGYACTP